MYGVKAGLAAALALVLTQALGVVDTVSAAFVAAACTSPTVLTGLKRGSQQLGGSVLGGAFAYAALFLGLPVPWALGMSVGLSVMVSGALQMRQASMIAAFTALYVVLLSPLTPHVTYGVRLAAVVLGSLAAMGVNVALSSVFYKRLFLRRARVCREALADALDARTIGGIDAASALMREFQSDLESAAKLPLTEHLLQEVSHLHGMAHHAKDALIRESTAELPLLPVLSRLLRGQSVAIHGEHLLALEARRWALLHDTLTPS